MAQAQSRDQHEIDSARRVADTQLKNDTAYLQTCFFIAHKYIYQNMYDSGQLWLNRIAARLPLRKPSFFSFYFSVFQSEAYYYNGLLTLDLHESKRILRIAEALNDSILLATANNFLGLAYMDVDSIRQGIPYFHRGIRYARQPPYDPKYWSKSMPHHLHGNLSEAYYKLGIYDSARLHARLSKTLAGEAQLMRGVAVAANLEGLIDAKTNRLKEARQHQEEAIALGLSNQQEDVALVAYGALADCFSQEQQRDSAMFYLKKGFDLLNNEALVNTNFAGQFLKMAMPLLEQYGEDKWLIRAQKIKLDLARKLSKSTDTQIGIIVSGSIANETRAAALELAEAKSKQQLSNIRLLIALVALLSLLVILVLNRRHHRKQLEELRIRQQISRDLHDDIGATLSSIKLYGELAQQQLSVQPIQSSEILGRINTQTNELIGRMGDVIWSMKPVTESQAGLQEKLKQFSASLLTPRQIKATILIDPTLDGQIQNPATRKELLLLIKEAFNNIAKYSAASRVQLTMKKNQSQIELHITDDGNGFDPAVVTAGNGLANMRNRCEQLGGTWRLQSQPGKGTSITCSFAQLA
ncbi:MAG TPA: histidine kinase [Ferruginibacter sp.]|nr:histidine kinase [Ferruginibacter sp.]